jgi:hypothetical protein
MASSPAATIHTAFSRMGASTSERSMRATRYQGVPDSGRTAPMTLRPLTSVARTARPKGTSPRTARAARLSGVDSGRGRRPWLPTSVSPTRCTSRVAAVRDGSGQVSRSLSSERWASMRKATAARAPGVASTSGATTSSHTGPLGDASRYRPVCTGWPLARARSATACSSGGTGPSAAGSAASRRPCSSSTQMPWAPKDWRSSAARASSRSRARLSACCCHRRYCSAHSALPLMNRATASWLCSQDSVSPARSSATASTWARAWLIFSPWS